MPITEVFPNPTVTNVIFQIRFPSVFSMESLVGQYQTRIMEKFPESRLLFAGQFVIAERVAPAGTDLTPNDAPKPENVQNIWNFKSELGVDLYVRSGSLDMSSTAHKTYDNPGAEHRFRDTIEFAVGNFLAVVPIPKLARIGLRYVDDCPVPERSTERFREYYKTSLPLERFAVEDALLLKTEARVRRKDCLVLFRETLQETDDGMKLTLDTDAYAEDVQATDYLGVTDRLHAAIVEEFEASIREPVYEHMRRAPGTNNGQ